jgi:hypothetical protein
MEPLLPKINMLFNTCQNLRDAQRAIKDVKLIIINESSKIEARELKQLRRLCAGIIIPRGFKDIFRRIKHEINQKNIFHAWQNVAWQNGWLEEGPRGRYLRADKVTVLTAVRRYGGLALADINDENLKNDEDVVLAALRSMVNGNCFFGAGREARNNVILALHAVQRHGLALRAASYRLRNDSSIVIAAVQQNGLALEFASDMLKDNDAVVRAAIAQEPRAIRFASLRFRLKYEKGRQTAQAIARAE